LAEYPGNRHNLITAGCLPPLVVFGICDADIRVRKAVAQAFLCFATEGFCDACYHEYL